MAKKEKEKGEVLILSITFDTENNRYVMGSSEGVSVNEIAFSVMALARTLVRAGYITDVKDFIEKIQHYCDDPQYEEVKQ